MAKVDQEYLRVITRKTQRALVHICPKFASLVTRTPKRTGGSWIPDIPWLLKSPRCRHIFHFHGVFEYVPCMFVSPSSIFGSVPCAGFYPSCRPIVRGIKRNSVRRRWDTPSCLSSCGGSRPNAASLARCSA